MQKSEIIKPPYAVPDGWKLVQLGDIAEINIL